MERHETCAVAGAKLERRHGWRREFLFVCLTVAGAVHSFTPGTPAQGASCLVTTPSGNVQGLDNGSRAPFWAFRSRRRRSATCAGNRRSPPRPGRLRR